VYRQSIADVWTAEIEKMQREGRIFSPVQLTVRCKDGTDKFVLGSATSVLKSADGIHLVVLFDITAQVAAQAALSVSLLEKEALLKEVHHRVKNNLQVISSLLRLEAGRSSHPATKGVLREMQGRIRSMALLHETLYRSGNFAAVDLADYLRQLSTQLHRSLFDRPGSIQLHVKVESVPAAIDHVIPCGLIVNELVTNCVKHGFPEGRTGEIRIELQRVAGGAEVCLRVADTGVGLPENFDPAQLQSLGLQLVSDLAHQLSARLAIGPGPGAAFAITFTPDGSVGAAPEPAKAIS
jgi:two-component sensor histidine kinase